MPKTKKVVKKAKKGGKGKDKGSGNVDVRVNVGTGGLGRPSRMEAAETRRIARSLGFGMKGMPFNYANRRRNMPPAGGGLYGGGGYGLAGSVQEAKTPNRTETFGATGFTPLDVRQREEAAARSIFRPSPIPPLPVVGQPSAGRSRLFEGRAGRIAAPPAVPEGRPEAAEERAQDLQEAASVASYGTSIGLPPPAAASGIFQASASPVAFTGSSGSGIGEGSAPSTFSSSGSGSSSGSSEITSSSGTDDWTSSESMITPSGEVGPSFVSGPLGSGVGFISRVGMD